MSKELTPLEALRYLKYGFTEEVDISIIEKSLKALEIIKECFNLSVEKNNNEFYVIIDNMYCVQLKNKQEYELLKEELNAL